MPCPEVHQLLVDIQVAIRCSPCPAIAHHISQRFTVTMAAGAGRLMRKLTSTSHRFGGLCARHFYETTPFASNVSPRGGFGVRSLLTTSCRSRRVVRGLMSRTFSRFASPVTTASLRRKEAQAGARGGKSLRLPRNDACACLNFCTCKLN